MATSVHDLKPDPRNARRHSEANLAMIEASLREVGAARSIVIDEDDTILAGNATVQSAKAAGIERVRVVDAEPDELVAVRRRGLTPLLKERLKHYDNRTAELGDWDEVIVAALEQEDPAILAGILAGDDLGAVLRRLAPAEGLTDPDEVPEAPAEPICQMGDLWQLGRHRLLCGDSTVVTDVERLMSGERAVLMATDPPYVVDYKGGSHPTSKSNKGAATKDKDWSATYREVDIEDGVQFFSDFISVALATALSESAAIYVWHASARQFELERALRDNGVRVHQQIIWHKSRPVLTYSHYMWAHEPCMYGWKTGHQPERQPAPNERSVWEIDSKIEDKATDLHPTQKPVEIFERPIRSHLISKEICYEPFCGSGTCVIAAEKVGVSCFAVELSPAYCDVIITRWQNFTGLTAERIPS